MAKEIQLAVGLDAGSSRTRCVVLRIDGDEMHYLSHGLSMSSGWSRGKIVDQAAVAHSITEAVKDAEQGMGIAIESATLGIGGSGILGHNISCPREFSRPRAVDQYDLTEAMKAAHNVGLPSDRMLLHVLPQDFALDGRAGFRKPAKSVGQRLEANVHLVTVSIQEHQALVDASHLAHVAIEETVFEPMASAYACVLPEDRKAGVALLDIGLNATGLIIYDGDAVQLAATLPVWGDRFTQDIAHVLSVSYEDAESLKQQYGCALLGLTSDSTLIEIPSPEGRASREAYRNELVEILEERAGQLFQVVGQLIKEAGMERRLGAGIVLTGGGSLLQGMCDMAEFRLNCRAGNGLAKGIASWPEELKSPVWTTAAGLAMYSAKLKLHRPAKRSEGGLLSFVTR